MGVQGERSLLCQEHPSEPWSVPLFPPLPAAGHHDCGMTKINPSHTIMRMLDSGIAPSTLETLEHAGIDVRRWLRGFDSVRQSVENSVAIIRKHPLVPSTVAVHGLIIDPKTGALELVVDGNKDLTYLAGMAEKAAAEARAAALGGYKGAMALAAAMAASSGAFTFSADPTAEAVAQSQRKQAADAALTSGGLMGSSGMGAAAGAGGSGAGASSSSSSATTVTPAAGGGGEGGAGSGSSSTTSSSSSGAFRSGSGLSASALGSSGGPSSGGSSGGAGMSGLFLRKISAPHQWPSHRDSLSDAFLSGSGISISVASPEAALAALGGGGGSGGRGSGGAGRAGGAAGAGAGAGNNVMIGDDEGGSFSPLHEFSDMSRRFSVAPVLGMADGTVCGEGDHGSEGMVTAVEASHHH